MFYIIAMEEYVPCSAREALVLTICLYNCRSDVNCEFLRKDSSNLHGGDDGLMNAIRQCLSFCLESRGTRLTNPNYCQTSKS